MLTTSPIVLRSLADLKRTVRPGTRLECIQHWQDETGHRAPRAGRTFTVESVSTVGFVTREEDGAFHHTFGKASAYTFDGDTYHVAYGTGAGETSGWTYRVLPG